ncbi:hypothetical protein VPH35_093981 [Triticum aestivum]|uniref:uncharacterized protein n=1 Tax=Triticum aestivum TaxID=4565 RepID=UPI0008427F11|nr:uncharacterized protein LOC123117603 [Triticum aestivum]
MAAGNFRFPDFALLDPITCIRDLRNATTAWALTTAGLTIQVSLAAAAPPRLSHFCVWCPGRDKTTFAYVPDVFCSAGDHALIRVGFTTGDSTDHYIVYRARGPDGRPSLDLLPDFDDYSDAESLLLPYGFVSHRKHLVIAALSDGPTEWQYYLHTLSCEPHSTWSKKLLRVEFLICDVLDPGVAALHFVPMPKLLPSNNQLYDNESRARAIRDVTFSRGYIRCVEFEELVECRATTVPAVPDPWDMDELQDSESADDPPQEEEEDVVVGWRLITWYRALTWNCWRKGYTVHSDELGIVSLPQIIGGAGACALKVPLKDLKAAAPTLRGDGDVVYLACELHEQNQRTWIVAVDTRRKLVGELCSVEEVYLYDPSYIPYVLTEYYLDDRSGGAQAHTLNACHPTPQNLDGSQKKRQRLS